MRLILEGARYYLEPDTSSEQGELDALIGGGRSARLDDVSTCDLNDALIQREGVEAVFLGPEDRITKTVAGPAWLIVNRD